MSTMYMSDSKRDRVIRGMSRAGGFYRENVDIFVQEYLGFTFLKEFQLSLLTEMWQSRTFLWIAARGMGKSFLIAIFVVAYAILYPGSKIVITAGKRGQSLAILEKIQTELMPRSANLVNEIDLKSTKFAGQDAKIIFKNTSFIKVVTASDNARSNRATILVIDEFRMVKKDVIDTVLKKFLTSRRMPTYEELTESAKQLEYAKEPNKSCYLSSAFFKDHWSYQKTVDTFRLMLDETKRDFMCGFPYQLSIQQGLLFPEDVESDMLETDFSELKWKMEMQAEWIGGEEGSFFNFDSISKNRHINYPMLPDALASKLGNSPLVKIVPKTNGEIRILSVDIALMSSKKHKNDATAIFINRMLPTKSGRYSNNIVYTDTNEGLRTDEQALLIRKLFDEYECDYIVLDCAGIGLGTFDALAGDIIDPATGEIYPALSCCNNTEMAARCTTPGVEKVIWAIKASAQFNSDCAFLLREGFRSGRIRLLVTEYDGEENLNNIRGYSSLSPSEKVKLQLPYINTTLLVDELTKLQHEESGGKVKVFEKSGMRKDRYSSLAYNYYVALQLENKMRRKQNSNLSNSDMFIIKPPSYKGKGGERDKWPNEKHRIVKGRNRARLV